MNRLIKVFIIVGVMLAAVTTSGFAANWRLLLELPGVDYQVDTETIQFLGEDTNKQLEVWMKSLDKDGTGSYNVAHYSVKENVLQFILKERTFFSSNGDVKSSFQNKSDKWTATTPISPIGYIATHLFAEYHNSPESFINNPVGKSPLAPEIIAARPTDTIETTETTKLEVDPDELKQALADEKIKEDKRGNGVRNYCVRDRRGPALFSGITHYVTADFCLSIDANNKRTATLNFSTEDTRSGTHKENKEITIQVDDTNWDLPAIKFDSGGYSSATFRHTCILPNSLVQALAATKKPVTIKWKHGYGFGWEDRERIIPDKTLRAIQLMYIGCK